MRNKKNNDPAFLKTEAADGEGTDLGDTSKGEQEESSSKDNHEELNLDKVLKGMILYGVIFFLAGSAIITFIAIFYLWGKF